MHSPAASRSIDTLAALVLVVLLSGTLRLSAQHGPALAQEKRPAQPPLAAQAPGEGAARPPARWLEAQAFTVSTRYNYIGDARDRTRQNRLQTQAQIRARLKIDPAGRYGVQIGLFTGSDFSSGWNPTGIGTGDATAKIYLKGLFVGAEPWNGVELQYGSLYPALGQSTEITTYDVDGYLTAGRLNLRRPGQVFFDEITVSVGYLGYLDTPFVLDRTGAFSRQNYWQLIASKRLLSELTLSTDYSVVSDDGMLRQAAAWRVGQPFVDTVKGEYGVRLHGGSHQTAFAFSGEKQVAGVVVQAGYANVDPVFGVLNGDSYGSGDRVFTSGSVPLPLDLSASWFAQKEISPPITSFNDVRVDLALTWDVLKTLERG